MSDVEKMTVELLKEMDDMSPESIEEFRKEWFEKLDKVDSHRIKKSISM